MSEFFVVATPIGNLKDITLRAIETLKEVDIILAEDTRKAKILLQYFNIHKPVVSYHQHSTPRKLDQILKWLKEGKKIALISEAGTPGISDPGNELISKIIEVFGEKIKIIPIPGPSAVTAIASVSGFPMDKFLFLGFPPVKKKRKKFFETIMASKYPVIFYESPYRILKTLEELSLLVPEREIVVCKELTKKFEKIFRGKVKEVVEKLKEVEIKGEFVIILNEPFLPIQ